MADIDLVADTGLMEAGDIGLMVLPMARDCVPEAEDPRVGGAIWYP